MASVARTVQYPTGTKIAPVTAWASSNFFIAGSASPVSHDSQKGPRQEGECPESWHGAGGCKSAGLTWARRARTGAQSCSERGRAGDGFWGQDGSRGPHQARAGSG